MVYLHVTRLVLDLVGTKRNGHSTFLSLLGPNPWGGWVRSRFRVSCSPWGPWGQRRGTTRLVRGSLPCGLYYVFSSRVCDPSVPVHLFLGLSEPLRVFCVRIPGEDSDLLAYLHFRAQICHNQADWLSTSNAET